MKIILEKNKRINICFERFGKIEMFMIEDIIETGGNNDFGGSAYVYARVKKITVENIDSKEFTLSKINSCKVERE